MMWRTVFISALLVIVGTTAYAQSMPPQSRPVNSAINQGDEKERAACHPDVVKHCQPQLKANPNDVLGILGCLQANRTKISGACQQVLASYGQ
jgi:hypothetical protein